MNSFSVLQKQIESHAKLSGRNPSGIKLVAVSKTKPMEAILQIHKHGQLDFGENYVQEFEHKYLSVEMLPLRWHFIGHLQSNKVHTLLGRVHLIHTLDRLSLAKKIEAFCAEKNFIQRCLIQVKLTKEDSKFGCPPEELCELLQSLAQMPHIHVQGLMTLGSLTEDKEKTRAEFRSLREWRDQLNDKAIYPQPLTELSMGMSHDFEIAIEEGATILRIGSLIFGERIK